MCHNVRYACNNQARFTDLVHEGLHSIVRRVVISAASMTYRLVPRAVFHAAYATSKSNAASNISIKDSSRLSFKKSLSNIKFIHLCHHAGHIP